MNCNQARELLATYHEYEETQADTADRTALASHLAQCTACAQYALIGKRLRALPQIKISMDAHTKLMHALAEEHLRFIQHAPPSTATPPTPVFLAPYLKEIAQSLPHTESLAAFSTADTGPIPVVRISKRRHRSPWSWNSGHFAPLGIVAAFLLLIMTGSVASLLVLANQGTSTVSNFGHSAVTSVHSAQIVPAAPYTTDATNPNVASALASNGEIYYTTYSNNKSNWMLEKFDAKSSTSTPLLTNTGNSPLIILGSSTNWLIWLQLDPPKTSDATQHGHTPLVQTWSLHTKYVGTTTANTNSDDTILSNDIFNPAALPDWVHTPVQGIWFTQNNLLVADVDTKGISHLWSYALDNYQVKAQPPIEIAHASAGHILTSPTENSNGTDIYWSEEWWSANQKQLFSNIWTQQIVEAIPERLGRWAAHMRTDTYQFRSDGHAFRPQIVDDTLFFLDTNNNGQATGNQSANNTPQPTTTASATPANTLAPTTLLGGTVRTDPAVYEAQIDQKVAGKLQTYSANGSLALPAVIEDNKPVIALQGGQRFLLWQTSDNAFEMYDVETRSPVIIDPDTIPKDAAFLAVNNDTAVWVVNSAPNANQNGQNQATIAFGTFQWPRPIALKDTTN